MGNKFKTNDYLHKKSVPVAERVLVNEDNAEKSIATAAELIGFPLIVKPTSSASSFGFYICHSLDELKRRVDQLLGCIDVKLNRVDDLVIEEYLQGTEYAVCSVSKNGAHAIPAIYRYEEYLIDGNSFIRSISLVEFCEPETEDLCEYALQVLSTLTYRQGQAAIEIMLTQDGPRLIEFNPRVGGLSGNLDLMVDACTGMSHAALASLSYQNQSDFEHYVGKPYKCKKHGKIIFLRN